MSSLLLVLPLLAPQDVVSATPVSGTPLRATRRSRYELREMGAAGGVVAFDGRLAALMISEGSQGITDLNGDGDVSDYVAWVHDLDSGVTHELGLATWGVMEIAGSRVFLQMSEGHQGSTDYTGDNDADDNVLLAWDADTESLATPGVSLGPDISTRRAWALSETDVAVLVYEQGEGADLNGDGDMSDYVLHHWDIAGSTLSNLGYAVAGGVVVESGLFLFRAHETPGNDYNGDGDALDTVLFAHDPVLSLTTNTGFASSFDPVAKDGMVAFLLDEFQQGGTDWNTDGDASDDALFLFHVASNTFRPLRFAIEDADAIGPHGFTIYSPGVRVAADHVAFLVSEAREAGADLNGDGDSDDHVLFVHEFSTDATRNLQLACFEYALDDELLVFEVPEVDQGALDLTGDGFANDHVAHVADLHFATPPYDLGLATTGAGGFFPGTGGPVLPKPFSVAEGRTVFPISEDTQDADLNADLDSDDILLFTYDVDGGLSFIEAGVQDPVTLDGHLAWFTVFEGYLQSDLNGDGDTNDADVLQVMNLDTGSVRNARVSMPGSFPLVHGPSAFARTRESNEGYTDLNSDGDTSDIVIRYVRVGI